MRQLILAVSLVTLAACVRDRGPDPALIAAAAGPAVRCIQRSDALSTRAVDANTILFGGLGRSWRNTLPAACSGLGRTGPVTIVFEDATAQVCANDRIRAVDSPNSQLPFTSYPLCRLGEFTPVDLRAGQ